jgi:hypothetical protein
VKAAVFARTPTVALAGEHPESPYQGEAFIAGSALRKTEALERRGNDASEVAVNRSEVVPLSFGPVAAVRLQWTPWGR